MSRFQLVRRRRRDDGEAEWLLRCRAANGTVMWEAGPYPRKRRAERALHVTLEALGLARLPGGDPVEVVEEDGA